MSEWRVSSTSKNHSMCYCVYRVKKVICGTEILEYHDTLYNDYNDAKQEANKLNKQ